MSVTVCRRGKTWQYSIRFTWPSGAKFLERRNAPGSSQSDAMRHALNRESALLVRGEGAADPDAKPAPKKTVQTFEEFWPRFMRDHCRAEQLKPSTIDSYERNWRIHLRAEVGSKRLDELDASAIAELKGKLAVKRIYADTANTAPTLKGRDTKTLKPKTINNVLIALSAALTAAKDWGLISDRPDIKFLPPGDSAYKWYEVHDYRRLLDAAAKIGRDRLLLVLLGGSAGLRRGEIIALKWSDLDIARRQIRVSRSVWWGKDADGGPVVKHETLPKGGRSRIVPMTPELVAALKAHRHMKSERVLCDGAGADLSTGLIESWSRNVQRRAGLPVTGAVHVLRHTFCSHLAAAGAPAKAIQELAGHVDLATTQKYLHLSPANRDGAMAVLARYYETNEEDAVVNRVDEVVHKLLLQG